MIPKSGYTEWFQELLKHNHISVTLNKDAFSMITISENRVLIDGCKYKGLVIYTGPLDELFECRFGSLPYRSLDFKWESAKGKHHQETPLVVNPSADDYTRITEYSYFPHEHEEYKESSYSYEIPIQYKRNAGMEPYYPIQTRESLELLKKYEEMAALIPNLICVGRLARFKYYNMDQALSEALLVCHSIDQ